MLPSRLNRASYRFWSFRAIMRFHSAGRAV